MLITEISLAKILLVMCWSRGDHSAVHHCLCLCSVLRATMTTKFVYMQSRREDTLLQAFSALQV